MSHPAHRAALAAACALGLAAPAGAQAAEQFVGVTDDNQVVTFRSDSPGNLQSATQILGLQGGERIVGIDVRPANSRIYALGSSSRLYILNPNTGVVNSVGDPFTPGLDGTSFGFDFNPSVDRIRIVSNTTQNLRANPDTGAIAAVDGNLQYAAGDPAAGVTPAVGSSAYTPAAFGAATTLFDIDSGRDTLVTQNPPNNGTLNTVGGLGVDITEPASFDVADTGTAYAALRRAGQANPDLFTINLTTGAATPVAAAPGIAARTSNRSTVVQPVSSIAALGPVGNDTRAPDTSIAQSSTQLRERLLSTGIFAGVACDEACTISMVVTRGGAAVGTATGAIVGSAGRTGVTVKLDGASQSAIRSRSVKFNVSYTITDAAGNRVTRSNTVRSQTLAQRLAAKKRAAAARR